MEYVEHIKRRALYGSKQEKISLKSFLNCPCFSQTVYKSMLSLLDRFGFMVKLRQSGKLTRKRHFINVFLTTVKWIVFNLHFENQTSRYV